MALRSRLSRFGDTRRLTITNRENNMFRVRLKRDVDRFPHFVAKSGLTGTLVELTKTSALVKMDEPLEGSEDWDNCIMWINDFDDMSKNLEADLELLTTTGDTP